MKKRRCFFTNSICKTRSSKIIRFHKSNDVQQLTFRITSLFIAVSLVPAQGIIDIQRALSGKQKMYVHFCNKFVQQRSDARVHCRYSMDIAYIRE
jgi:hypothetical protein